MSFYISSWNTLFLHSTTSLGAKFHSFELLRPPKWFKALFYLSRINFLIGTKIKCQGATGTNVFNSKISALKEQGSIFYHLIANIMSTRILFLNSYQFSAPDKNRSVCWSWRDMLQWCILCFGHEVLKNFIT